MRYRELIAKPLDEARPAAGTKVLMVTGQLALPGLQRVMQAISPDDFTYDITALDIQVAAWLNTDLVIQGVGHTDGYDLLIIPGRVQGDESDIERELGIPVVRGPNCYSELPEFFEEIGLELDADAAPSPKLAVIGSGSVAIAEFLASTYENKIITVDDLTREGLERGMSSDAIALHNVMAELVRARLSVIPIGKGYVLRDYPRTARDLEWLDSMRNKPDAIITCGVVDETLASALSNRPGHIHISEDISMREQQVEAYKKVEELLRTCVAREIGT